MLKFAGLPIAVANAPDDIKAVCRDTAPSNNDNAIAFIINKYIKIKKG